MLVPGRAALLGRIGGYTTHSLHDPRATTSKARETFLARFEALVDPDGVLPPEERTRRSVAARKAHFARLALARAATRRPARGAAA